MRRALMLLAVVATAGCPPREAPDSPADPSRDDGDSERPTTPPGMLACTTRALGSDIPGWPNSLVLADLDRDGAVDAAVEYGGGSVDSRLSIQLNSGDGNLAEVQNLRLAEISYALGAADLDGDGAVELFTNDYNKRRLLLFSLDDKGRVGAPKHVRSRFQPGGINPHDTDGDGDLDLVVNSLRHVQIVENRGGTSFRGAGWVSVKQAPDEVVAADLDHDGETELMVVANDTDKLFTLAVGAQNNLSVARAADTCKKPSVTQAADLDGDKAADVAYRCNDGFVTHLSESGKTVRTASPDIDTMGLGDLDADGDIDVITAGQPCSTCGSMIRFFANDGRGGFEESSTMEVDGIAGPPRIADLDGDRAPDLVLTIWPGAPPGRLAVFLGGACGKL